MWAPGKPSCHTWQWWSEGLYHQSQSTVHCCQLKRCWGSWIHHTAFFYVAGMEAVDCVTLCRHECPLLECGLSCRHRESRLQWLWHVAVCCFMFVWYELFHWFHVLFFTFLSHIVAVIRDLGHLHCPASFFWQICGTVFLVSAFFLYLNLNSVTLLSK